MRIYLAWVWWILTMTVRMPMIPPGEGNSANGGGGNTTVDHAANQPVKLVVSLAGSRDREPSQSTGQEGLALDESQRACPPMAFLCPRKPLWPFPRFRAVWPLRELRGRLSATNPAHLDPPATRTGRRQSGSGVGARHTPSPQSSMALPQPGYLGQECPCLGHSQCGCGPSSCRVRSTSNGARRWG